MQDFSHLRLPFLYLNLLRSGLAGQEHILIFPKEIESLNSTPALVVVSSCDSARGEVKAEGVIGIARAFQHWSNCGLLCFRFYHRIRISNSIISTVNHYSTTTTIVLTITPSTHVHTYNYNHVCYMCSAHVQILQFLPFNLKDSMVFFVYGFWRNVVM